VRCCGSTCPRPQSDVSGANRGQFEAKEETSSPHARGILRARRHGESGTVSHDGDLGPLYWREMLGDGRPEVERFRLGKSLPLHSPGFVAGRVDDVKTEYSEAPLPLDPALAEVISSGGGGPSFLPNRTSCSHRPTWREKSPTHLEHAAQPSEPAAVKAGLGPIGWHTLRHTYRAWLGDNGEPLTVQKELMRHASIQTTLNTYGGGMMESMREAHGRVVKQAMAR